MINLLNSNKKFSIFLQTKEKYSHKAEASHCELGMK